MISMRLQCDKRCDAMRLVNRFSKRFDEIQHHITNIDQHNFVYNRISGFTRRIYNDKRKLVKTDLRVVTVSPTLGNFVPKLGSGRNEEVQILRFHVTFEFPSELGTAFAFPSDFYNRNA